MKNLTRKLAAVAATMATMMYATGAQAACYYQSYWDAYGNWVTYWQCY